VELVKDHLETLKRLADLAPTITDLRVNGLPEIVIDDMDNGYATGVGIKKVKGEFAIKEVFMPPNATFKVHRHNYWEVFITLEGHYTVHIDNEDKEIIKEQKVGDVVYFKPNQDHWGEIHEFTHGISIAIGGTEGYPDA